MTHSLRLRGAPRRVRTTVALACLAAILAACGGSDGGEAQGPFFQRVGTALETTSVAAPASRRVVGQVVFDAPVAGAEVALRSPAGAVLARAVSNENGGFVLELPPQLPRDFLVVATAPAFAGTLLLVQDDFDSQDPTLRVGVLTTLAARVLDAGLERGAGTTPAEAADAVRRHLDLPANHDLRDHDVRLFDVDAFLAAQQGEPLDAALQRLAARIVAEPGFTQPYHGVLLGGSLEEDALAAIGTSVARYGLDHLAQYDNPVSEKISSWGLTVLDWLDPQEPDYSARFDQIDRKLEDMTKDIGVIQRQVYNLERKMEAGFERVTEVLQGMDDRADARTLTQSYTALSTTIMRQQATVEALQRTYMMYLEVGHQPELPKLIDSLADTIIDKVPAALLELRNVQVGTGTPTTSAAAIWHRLQAIAAPGYPMSVGSEFFDAINQQQDQVAAIQVLGLNLLMEAYNFKANQGPAPGTLAQLRANVSPFARAAFNTYSRDIEATQATVAYPRIDPGLVANLHTGRLHVRHAAAMRLDNGCTQLHLAWHESGREEGRELRSPGTDCDFRFTNAVRSFNAMKPFGFADWSVGEMAVFQWQRGRPNLEVARELGYDFSAIFRHGSDARSSRVIGVEAGAAVTRWGFQGVGTFGYINPPHTTLRQLEAASGSFHNVFFSRPIKPDPLAQGCSFPDGWTVRCKFL